MPELVTPEECQAILTQFTKTYVRCEACKTSGVVQLDADTYETCADCQGRGVLRIVAP